VSSGLREAWNAAALRLSRPLPPKSAGVTLGSVALFLIVVQAVTGGLLAIYYVPSWTEAHASVAKISKEVEFGWLIRSVHAWSAHLLVAVVLVHLARVFARGSYAKPRRETWLAGAALLFLLMGAAFTGQMLPMDNEAVQGARVADSYARDMRMSELIKGGSHVGQPMLTRMFAFHVIWIPAGLLFLVAAHVALVARHRLHGAETLEGTSPEFPRRLAFSILGAAALVAVLAFIRPVGIGPVPGDEAAKPLWMFLPVYQAAKSVSGPWTLLLLIGPPAFLLAIPFLPRKVAVVLGVLFAAGAVVLGILGARS
jgi:quinol-cytochrome oxidoreductase complex cytochrome b subunit